MDENVASERMKGIAELCKAEIITIKEAREALKDMFVGWKNILTKNDKKQEE